MTIDEILRKFQQVKPAKPHKGMRQWKALCPAHEDRDPSLTITEGKKRAFVRCFAGCAEPAILSAAGLADLWYEQAKKKEGRRLTVAAFAADKALPPEFLAREGVTQHGNGIQFAYRRTNGTRATRDRVRYPGKGLVWDERKGSPDEPYGSWRLRLADTSHLWIVEGESDALTAWHCGLACLGVPGATMTHLIGPEHVVGVKTIYIIKEPDQGGQAFVNGLAVRLEEIGFAGRALVIAMPDALKDISELHLKCGGDGEAFADQIEQAVRTGVPLEKPVAATPTPATSGQHYNLTSLGNSERLVRSHGGDLAFTGGIGWLIWSGERWREDPGKHYVQRYAKAVVKAMHAEAADRSDYELEDWALSCENRAKLTEMAALAEESVLRQEREFDARPMLFNVLNGTLDLATGRLRPHDRGDLITQLSPVAFAPGASAPTWERFIWEVMAGRQALVDFLRRLVGYCLTGSVKEQCFTILHGLGENGKSTFLETVRAMLGPEYARQAPTATFLRTQDSGAAAKPDVARMRGARLVSAVEPERGARLAEGVVKAMTGGDMQVARHLYREFFEYAATHKIILSTNHKPRITGTGHAIWRRIHLIPFEVSFQGRADKDMPDRLRAEMAGILNWSLQGCQEWLERGLDPPDEVLAAVAQYRREEDRLADFWNEHCVFDRKARVSCGELFNAYRRWCEDEYPGEKEMSSKAFGMAVAERGIARPKAEWIHGKKMKMYCGVGLADGTDGTDGTCQMKVSVADGHVPPEAGGSLGSSDGQVPSVPSVPPGPKSSFPRPPIPGAVLGVVTRVTRREGDRMILMDGDTMRVIKTWNWYDKPKPSGPHAYLSDATVDLDRPESVAKWVIQSGKLRPSAAARDVDLVFKDAAGVPLDEMAKRVARERSLDDQAEIEIVNKIVEALKRRSSAYRRDQRPPLDPDDPMNDREPEAEVTDDDCPF